MYLSALEFLEEERDAWRPYEALEAVTDALLDEPVEAAHGWSARDLMAHVSAWQGWALAIARDLAMNETSASMTRLDELWEARGDQMNDDISAEWRALPIDEVRRRFRETPGELRGHLTVVPESRWVKHADHLRTFIDETIDHYEEHRADLDAILGATA